MLFIVTEIKVMEHKQSDCINVYVLISGRLLLKNIHITEMRIHMTPELIP